MLKSGEGEEDFNSWIWLELGASENSYNKRRSFLTDSILLAVVEVTFSGENLARGVWKRMDFLVTGLKLARKKRKFSSWERESEIIWE